MYSRETELRHLRSNDVYKLAVILDDNQCWKKLMEIIPKEPNQSSNSATPTVFKYSNDHIRLIEGAIQRQGESRLYSQILFDEWGTSGRKHERPTIGVLLQLLVRAELFRAADFVAINFLDEPPPARPSNGPAARIDVSLTDEVFADLADMVNDSSFYPGTTTLNANYANSITDNNKDYYTKYQQMDKNVDPPKPPPRVARTARQQVLQQQKPALQQLNTDDRTDTATIQAMAKQNEAPAEKLNSLTKFSTPMTSHGCTAITQTTDNNSSSQEDIEFTSSKAPIPMISILAQSMTTTSKLHTTADAFTCSHEILPVISALNLNGAHYGLEAPHQQSNAVDSETFGSSRKSSSGGSQSSSLSNDENDSLDEESDAVIGSPNRKLARREQDADDGSFDENDEDNSLPNLSILEQRSSNNSNNDSSLTTVTGTSGDNSFDLNDCSSTSNDIPCLSALKQ